MTDSHWNFEVSRAGDTRHGYLNNPVILTLVTTGKILGNIALTYKYSHLWRSANATYILINVSMLRNML